MEKLQSRFKSNFESFLSAISQYNIRYRRAAKITGVGTVENLEKIRILETKMYQELLISGLIIPFYFVCEMCEVYQLNQVQIGMIRSNEN